MQKTLDNLYSNQSLIYKVFLYLVAVSLIVYLFPKGGKFKYEFQKGKPWQYENLYAPFDFAILKTDEELAKEKQTIKDNQIPYFSYDNAVVTNTLALYDTKFSSFFNADDFSYTQLRRLKNAGETILSEIYNYGVLQSDVNYNKEASVYLLKGNEATLITFDKFFRVGQLEQKVEDVLFSLGMIEYKQPFFNLFFDIIKPNVTLDATLTQKDLDEQLAAITTSRGSIDNGKLIIAKGEVVEGEKFQILTSLKNQFESELWSDNNYTLILLGYTILVALALIMLLLFLKKYRPRIFDHNTKVTFIFTNVLLMVFLTTLVVKFNANYVFVVPLCILPLILKAFFDARLGLFAHVLTVLILGFVVPNSFEFLFLQIIAGIVTILTVSELYKRANLFISVGQITLIYIISYFAFHIIQEGTFQNFEWVVLGYFILNGLATLFAQPLIYIYEKIFGLVSDVSLLELSDTNSKLLKDLANKAPGTFHHSLQVANLAEAAANEVNANAMLVRVGALYHDVGKMNNPTYFTENQTTNINPHDELQPKESARIIINHVIEGIEMARKQKIPDRVIDFIRTHHGTSNVYYFYKKQQELEVEANEEDFKYPGPIPFSKETAILMMCDAVEAASKSLKNPTYTIIDDFVENIIDNQIAAGQFLNANITFKEIEAIKKVLKKKLTNIYHLRVEYPE
jgi:hypothetical protein